MKLSDCIKEAREGLKQFPEFTNASMDMRCDCMTRAGISMFIQSNRTR